MWLLLLVLLATSAHAQTVPLCAQGTDYLCATDTSVTHAGSCIGDASGDWCGTVDFGLGTPTVLAPIINGSSASGGDLKLRSTTHGTKGQIEFGAAGTSYFDETDNNWIMAGRVKTYNNVATVSKGLTGIVAEVNLTAQGANIAGTTFYTPPAAGFYRISVAIAVTRIATSSSTLPNVVLAYTDGDNAALQLPQITASSTGNTLGTVVQVTHAFYAAASAIQFQAGTGGNVYASSGATSMQYRLRIRLEAL